MTETETYGRTETDSYYNLGRYINRHDNLNARFCKDCKIEVIKLRKKYNQRISRLKQAKRELVKLGGIGRIRQKMEFNKKAHKEIKRLKSQVRYWRQRLKK